MGKIEETARMKGKAKERERRQLEIDLACGILFITKQFNVAFVRTAHTCVRVFGVFF